ncbi:FAD-dependent oxidoreductase [Thermaurantimonas aggregans]|uniref:FAD-dependent oxidoreductase n=1 Tax=Thermaurantimonas aggregans TaxID=2173829 RepID=A0A401XMX7_9FLAO|nr:FAD-dependent oxidoreductase [Thermaurantimonas aggregans]MCX8149744.1 FAD-binding oxidoreductase [Thermaurantimonas aggregans]GCD78371.1 FAD-dependent oxidoreductase [Thermaurantimonas aggregans]
MHLLLVGQGIAGSAVALLAEKAGIHITNISLPLLSNSSLVASGLWNPVVLKRMTLVWRAGEMLEALEQFYPWAEKLTGATFYHPKPIFRLFHSAAEVNDWQAKSTQPLWDTILEPEIAELPNFVKAPFGAGRMKRTGWVNTWAFIEAVHRRLQFQEKVFFEEFHYDRLKILDSGVEYAGISYDGVIFADGIHAWQRNPWFPRTFMRPTRGDVLTLSGLPDNWDFVLHFSHFLLPIEGNRWKLGATYDFRHLSPHPNLMMANEMLDELRKIANVSFKVEETNAGIRPNTKDRRPLIGAHPQLPQLYFINGLGSRGVLMAPKLAEWLLDFVKKGSKVPAEIDVARAFEKKK